MNTSGKRRRTLVALVVVVLALVCVSGVMAYRTAQQGTQDTPSVTHSPQATNPQRYGTPDTVWWDSFDQHENEYGGDDDHGENHDDDRDGNSNAAGTCSNGCQTVVTTTHAS
jgi:hypothetical protein